MANESTYYPNKTDGTKGDAIPAPPAGYVEYDLPPDRVSNGCEVSFEMTDPAYLDSIYVGGTCDCTVLYHSIVNTKPYFQALDDFDTFIKWNGTNWTTQNGTVPVVHTHPTATGYFPPLTGWPDIAGATIALDYKRWFIDTSDNDNCVFIRRDHADWLLRPNLDHGQIDQWEDNGVCVVKKCAIYPQDKQWTEGEYIQGVRWAGNPTCGVGPVPFP